MIPEIAPKGKPPFSLAPQWLVSVREMEEAQLALEFSIDILDFKDPSMGPLAPVSLEIMHSAVERLGRRTPGGRTTPQLSLALGELDESAEIASRLPQGFAFAKAGPRGVQNPEDLTSLWQRLRALLPVGTELVAVAYADHQSADCLPPQEILSAAIDSGFQRILIDTFEKSGGATTEILSMETIAEFAQQTRRNAVWWAMAGSITLEVAEQLACKEDAASLMPSCFAMRGDVCQGDRSSRLSVQRLGIWEAWLRTQRAQVEAQAI